MNHNLHPLNTNSTVLTLRAPDIDAHHIMSGLEAWQAAGLPLRAQGGAA